MPEFNPDSIPVLDDIVEDSPEKISSETTDDEPAIFADGDLDTQDDQTLDLFASEPDITTDIIDDGINNIDIQRFISGDDTNRPHDLPESNNISDTLVQPDDETLENQDESLSNFSALNISSETVSDDALLSMHASEDDEFTDSSEIASISIDSAPTENDPTGPPATVKPEAAESALIDYPHLKTSDSPHTEIDVEAEAVPSNDSITDKNVQQNELIKSSADDSQQIALQPLVDQIIRQLMPELEQQLHDLVKQTLKEQLPEEIIKEEIIKNED